MSERRLPSELAKVVKAIKNQLSAEVDVERVPMDDPWPDQFRLAVVSRKFRSLSPFKRQDLVWEIVNRILSPGQALAISVILTFSPAELEPASRSKK